MKPLTTEPLREDKERQSPSSNSDIGRNAALTQLWETLQTLVANAKGYSGCPQWGSQTQDQAGARQKYRRAKKH